MRTVIYARFSSTLQNERSVEDQLALCRDRCAREGWPVLDVFTDHAISGAAGIDESARPGLNALLARVEGGGIDQVLAEATDRIARHQGDAFAIRERVNYAGARIFTLSDGEVTDIIAAFRGLSDSQFRKDLAAKVKRGQRGTIGEKRSAAGIAFGYRSANRIDDRGHVLRGLRVIDPAEAETVRRIFREYARGDSPRAIAAGLNRDGVPAPRGRSGDQSFWRASTIYGDKVRRNGLLHNRLYIGELVFGRTRKLVDPRTRKTKIVVNPEDDWQVEPVPELRIVDQDLWDSVAAALQSRSEARPEQSRRPRHLLSGLATCGTCGGGWTVRTPGRWGCSRSKEGGQSACANTRTVKTEILEARVLAGLRDKLLDPALVEIYVREYHQAHARRAKELDGEGDQLRARHRAAEARIANLVEIIASGGKQFTELLDALRKAKADRDSLADQIAQLDHLPVIALHPTIAADYRRQVEQLNAALAENPEAAGEVIPRLRSLIDRITVHPAPEGRGVTIEVTGKLTEMLALAAGEPAGKPAMYGNDGAGKGNRALPQFLRAVV